MIEQVVGIFGLLLITAGILIHKRQTEDTLYFFGGLCLLVYSWSINDWIFIILQCVFIAAAAYDYVQSGREKHHSDRY